MDSEDGDGIVTVNNSVLSDSINIKNYFIKGSCTATEFFHNEILDTKKYPELFEIVKEALK